MEVFSIIVNIAIILTDIVIITFLVKEMRKWVLEKI